MTLGKPHSGGNLSTLESVDDSLDAWVNTQPGDIVIHAAHWQGTLDSPAFEPTDADWDDYCKHSIDMDRLDALRRMDDHEYEARMRYGA
jgi:hypothetical protein